MSESESVAIIVCVVISICFGEGWGGGIVPYLKVLLMFSFAVCT